MLILSRRHLEEILAEYVVHYNEHRPHWALGQLARLTQNHHRRSAIPSRRICVAGMPSSI